MHRNNIIRLSLVFATFFLCFLLLFTETWYYEPRVYETGATVNYIFLQNQTASASVENSVYNATISFTSYGSSITLESYFRQNVTLANESYTGRIILYSLPTGGGRTLISQYLYNSTNGTCSLSLDLHPGSYVLVSYLDLYFHNYNYTQRLSVINSRPGTAGIVTVILSFPQILFYPVIISGAITLIFLALSAKGKRTYLEL